MNTENFKTLSALTKAIKREQDKGILQFAIFVNEDVDKQGNVTRSYEMSRPFFEEAMEEE